jgi:hypothetical protein
LVLINATTAPALVSAVSNGIPGVVTLGPTSPAVSADVAVATTDDNDRAAYDALAKGTPLEQLIHPPFEKKRYDEAALAQERAKALNPDSEDEDSAENTPAPGEKTEKESPKKPATPPLVDAVLRRAVQLHRTLVALKKA